MMVVEMFGLSKIAIYLLIALFSLGGITTTYYVWKRNIEHAALLEFNRQQTEQTAKDQAEFIHKQQELAEKQRHIDRLGEEAQRARKNERAELERIQETLIPERRK
jgi:hypothetical protein